MATRGQLSMIHTLKSKVGMSDEDYRALLSGFGVESSKELTGPGAKELIEALMRLVPGGALSFPPRRVKTASADAVLSGKLRHADSNEVATFKQQAMIRAMWNEVSRAPESERAQALNNFLEKRFQISHIRWLPRERVGKVIRTLEAMKKQQPKPEEV
jgi:hypothetical protein